MTFKCSTTSKQAVLSLKITDLIVCLTFEKNYSLDSIQIAFSTGPLIFYEDCTQFLINWMIIEDVILQHHKQGSNPRGRKNGTPQHAGELQLLVIALSGCGSDAQRAVKV